MKARKLAGLFINCIRAKDSIFESGAMAFQCLTGSEKYSLDYAEISPENVTISTAYDFYFFNYHLITMSWLDTATIKALLPGVKFTMVLEVAPNDPFVLCSPVDFDAYCVLDPTLNTEQENVFAFPRPLEIFDEDLFYEPKEVPVIGSFGFATPGKGFEHVIDAVNREFEQAVVRINIPYATYTDEGGTYAKQLAQMCRERAKSGIEVVVTHDFMTKSELIKWCAENTLNCFLYDRNQPGLAATTDQAITSGRPLIVSKNNTFRHIQKYIKPFPYQSLKDAIEYTPQKVEEIQKDWSPEKFREQFEAVLDDFQFAEQPLKNPEIVQLTLKPPPPPDGFVQKARTKIAVRTRLRRLGKLVGIPSKVEKFKPKTSYAQFGEDVIVSDLFDDLGIRDIRYLDIGANNPQYISNTFLFYEQGFQGVLVEPNAFLCEKLKAARPRDTVLNFGIGIDSSVKEADFYLFPEASDGLSTFSRADAEHWETIGMNGVKYKIERVLKVPLLNINDVIARYFTECPDFISIDVEGWDLRILETLNFERYTPAVFCVETLAYKADGSTCRLENINEFFESKGYFSFRETVANDIFVNKNLYDFYLYQKNNGHKSE